MPVLGGTPRARTWGAGAPAHAPGGYSYEYEYERARVRAAALSARGAYAGDVDVDARAYAAGDDGDVDASDAAVERARRHAEEVRSGRVPSPSPRAPGLGGDTGSGGVAAPSALLSAALGGSAAEVSADELAALSGAYERMMEEEQKERKKTVSADELAALSGAYERMMEEERKERKKTADVAAEGAPDVAAEDVAVTEEAVAAASARARRYAAEEAGVRPHLLPEANTVDALERAKSLTAAASGKLPDLTFGLPGVGEAPPQQMDTSNPTLSAAKLSEAHARMAREMAGMPLVGGEGPVLAVQAGSGALLMGSGGRVPTYPYHPDEPLQSQQELASSVSTGNGARARAPTGAARRAKRTYKLALRTGSAADAGTSAVVSVCLRGAGGRTSGMRRLPSGEGLFVRGNTDVFWLDAPELGPLEALEVSHDGGGHAPGWQLAGASVVDVSTSIEVDFPAGVWFDAKRGDGATSRTLFASGRSGAQAQHAGAEAGTAPLVLTLSTADEYGSGTDADVAVEVWGKVRGVPASSGMWRLRNDGRNFSRGAVSSFVLTGLPRLDRVTSVKVGLEPAGAEPRWRLDRASVLDADSGTETTFAFSAWLDRRAGLVAELADGEVLAQPKQRKVPTRHPVVQQPVVTKAERERPKYEGLPSDPLARRTASTKATRPASAGAAGGAVAVPTELPVTPAVAAAWTYLPPQVAKALEGDPFSATLSFVDENAPRVARLFADRDMRMTVAEVDEMLLARARPRAAAREHSHFRAMLVAGARGDFSEKELRTALKECSDTRNMVRRGLDGGGRGERAATEIHAGEVLKRLGLFLTHGEHAERSFGKFDADRSGYLEPVEQLALIKHVMPSLAPGVLRYVMAYLDSLDADGDGRLSFPELRAVATGERGPKVDRSATQLQPMAIVPQAFPVAADGALPINMVTIEPTLQPLQDARAAGSGGELPSGDATMQRMKLAGAAEAHEALVHAAAAAQAASRAASLASGAGSASTRLAQPQLHELPLQERAAAAAAQAEALVGAASLTAEATAGGGAEAVARRVTPAPSASNAVAAMSVPQVAAFVRSLEMDDTLWRENSVSGKDLLGLSDGDLKEHLGLTALQVRKLRRELAQRLVAGSEAVDAPSQAEMTQAGGAGVGAAPTPG